MEERKPAGFWTRERCINDIKEYNTLTELIENNNKLYVAIRRNRWFDLYEKFNLTNHSPNFWTEDECLKQINLISTYEELFKNNHKLYRAIISNKWYHLFEKFNLTRKVKNYWSYENCKIEALKYTTRKEMRIKNSSVYSIINRKKWGELFSHMIIEKRANGTWIYENCKLKH